MMNLRYFYVVTVLIMIVAFLEPVKADAVLCLDHYHPLEPVKGDTVEFYVVGLTGNGSDILSVEIEMDDQTQSMAPLWEDSQFNNGTATIYFCTVEVQGSGTFNITYTAVLDNGSSIVFRGHALHVNGTEDEDDDTIFGLPKTYCAISVVFITVIVIFVTWSYFKGRKMQKKIKDEAESSNMVCSACGAPISIDDRRCPKCNAELDEEEHVCGACRKAISDKDAICPHCGVKLKTETVDEKGKTKEKDPDLEKIGSKVDMTGKVKCRKCGTVYLEKEGSCPECVK